MNKRDRASLVMFVFTALSWFGLPIIKAMGFIITGYKWIGPVIAIGNPLDDGGPSDLGLRLILLGVFTLIAGIVFIVHSVNVE